MNDNQMEVSILDWLARLPKIQLRTYTRGD